MTGVSQQKTAHSLVWSAVESGSLALISFGSLVIYSRLLSGAEFGLFSVVFAIIDLLSIFVTMLFHDALVQRRDITERHYDTAFTATVLLSIALVLLCWLAAPAFERAVDQPDAGRVLGWMGLMFPAMGLSATIVARQRREFAFRSLALRSLLGRVLGGGVGVAMAFAGAGVWSLVVQQTVTAMVGSLVLWITVAQGPRLRFGWAELKQLLGFGAFSVGSLLLSLSIKRLFTIFAGFDLGVATAGYLNLGFRVVDVLWSISATAVGQVSLPLLAGLQADPARVRSAYQRAVGFTCLVLYPCFAGIAVTAPEIVDTIFGHRWSPAVPAIVVLAGLVLIQAPRLFVNPVLTAVGRPRDMLVAVAAQLVFMLAVIALFGMPSLWGAMDVWLASECVLLLVTVWILRRATGYGLKDQFAGARAPLLAALAMAAAVAFARAMLPADWTPLERLVTSVAVGGPVYMAAILALDRGLASSFIVFVRSAFLRQKPSALDPQPRGAIVPGEARARARRNGSPRV